MIDLRDHILPFGAPAASYPRGRRGLATGAEVRMPPSPNPRSSEAVLAYLVALWEVIAGQRGQLEEGTPGAAALRRLSSLGADKNVQRTLALAVSAGPLESVPGAAGWLRTVDALRGQVKNATGEEPIAAVPGSAAAAMAATAAAAAGKAAELASAASASRPEDGAARRKAQAAAELAEQARTLAGGIIQETAAGTTAALSEAASAAPGAVSTVSEAFAALLGGIAGIPAAIVGQVTTVPDGGGLLDRLESSGREVMAAVERLASQTIEEGGSGLRATGYGLSGAAVAVTVILVGLAVLPIVLLSGGKRR